MEDRIQETVLYERFDEGVRCGVCERRCFIPEDELGFCRTRQNLAGSLHTLVYGDIASMSANPIEKKPFFHFFPGTNALTVGTWSCNFTCPWCQNWDTSKSPQNVGKGQYVSPNSFIELVSRYGCQGTSISLNEPTLLFEYSLDVFSLARESGYYNTLVTNGYMTAGALRLLVEHGLDAVNIDIKGDAKMVSDLCEADVEVVWRNAALFKNLDVWVELTTLIIPGLNDAHDVLRGIASRIKTDLGDDVPWHVTGYSPAYRFAEQTRVPATPVSSLERARRIGVSQGLKFVYAGNLPGHPYEDTYCPRCGQSLIERFGFRLTRYNLTPDMRCPDCGEDIPIIGEPMMPSPTN